jgi:outer membrane lipoprotein LolB
VVRFSFLLLLVLLFSACSQPLQVPDSGPMQAWKSRQAALMNLTDWKLQGRVGLYTEQEAWPGDLHWQQSGAAYDMRIIAPLGVGNLHVYSVEGGVMLEHSSEPQAYFSSDPEVLIQKQYGWKLPISNLRYWMTGLPSPLSSLSGKLDLDEHGRLQSLQQSGWHISFQHYKKIAGYDLPTKVLLEHQDLSVKIVVRKWQV